MIKEVTQFVATKAGLVIGTTLHAGHRPQDAPDACDVVLESAGGQVYFDLPERADPAIQILSRALTYMTARDRAWAIYDAIFRDYEDTGSAGWKICPVAPSTDTYEVMIIEPLAPPQWIGQDTKLRHEFSCNYIFKVKKL